MGNSIRETLLNEDCSDMSQEGYVIMAIFLEMIYGCEIIAYQMSDALDRIGAKGTLFQTRKQNLNQARRSMDGIVRNLETAFDGTFDQVFNRLTGKEVLVTESVQALANDMIRLMLVYFSRGDGDPDKRKNMQKALENFKPMPNIDLNKLLKFFKVE